VAAVGGRVGGMVDKIRNNNIDQNLQDALLLGRDRRRPTCANRIE
jgi:hypothetical protein